MTRSVIGIRSYIYTSVYVYVKAGDESHGTLNGYELDTRYNSDDVSRFEVHYFHNGQTCEDELSYLCPRSAP